MVIFHQGRQAPADAEIDARPDVGGVRGVHVIALFAGHHLQRQLIVIAQEYRPLTAIRYVRSLLHDLGDRIAVFLRDRHVDARHQGKVVGHVALIAVAEIFAYVFRPLIRLGEKKPILIVGVDRGTELLDDLVRLAKILVIGAFALDQVGDRIESKAVDPQVQPKTHDFQNRIQDRRIVEIQIRLVTEKSVPVVRLRDLVQFELSVSRKITRVSRYFWSVSLQT